jgi:MFS family permease
VIGITNTIGRVFCGWISDRPQVNALLINNVALTIGGTATILSPILFNSYASLIVYGAIFGFSIGSINSRNKFCTKNLNFTFNLIACFAALRSVITVELLGLERLTSAFGLLLMFQGIAVTIGSPIAGNSNFITLKKLNS